MDRKLKTPSSLSDLLLEKGYLFIRSKTAKASFVEKLTDSAANRYIQFSHKRLRRKLNQVSPSFCPAKWLQVTIHLPNAQTHSCHHPSTHAIPLEEIQRNPSALHNTSFKKKQRKLMLEGKRPEECDYCWRIEDSSPEALSDRVFKSNTSWAKPQIDKIARLHWDADIAPTYLEVNLSRTCNFKCAYCPPQINSGTLQEIIRHGPYPTSDRLHSIDHFEREGIPLKTEDAMPYTQAFWKWWPRILPQLQVFRITGGEPLLSDDTYRIFEELSENPQSHLTLGINTNLGVSPRHLDRFLAAARKLIDQRAIRALQVFTSLDAIGPQGEYVRFGLRFAEFDHHLRKLREILPEAPITLLCTFQALCVSRYGDYLNYVFERKKEFGKTPDGRNALALGVSYLRFPEILSVPILPKEYLSLMQNWVNQADRLNFPEAERIRRIHEWWKNERWDGFKLRRKRADFYLFFSEYDRRRKTDFRATFPEMEDFWELCKKAAMSLDGADERT